eukprot:631332-Heterocapsa_arctica.AAC.1
MEDINKNKQVAGDQMQQHMEEVMKNVVVDIGTQKYELVIDDHKLTTQTEDESTDEGEQYQDDIDTQ